MAVSATQNFNPTLGSIGAFALGRCNVRRTAIDVGHLADMAMAANLVLVDFAGDQPNLWSVILNSIPLVQGTTTYAYPANVLLVLDCYIRKTVGGVNNDRIIYGVSRSEYASYPNKQQQAFPTTYWADRVVPLQTSLYPTPDGNGPYTLFSYVIQQDDDAVTTGAKQLDLPYRAMSAFADALAAKLALTYAPDRFALLDGVAQRSYAKLNGQENENVPLYVIPGLSGYYR